MPHPATGRPCRFRAGTAGAFLEAASHPKTNCGVHRGKVALGPAQAKKLDTHPMKCYLVGSNPLTLTLNFVSHGPDLAGRALTPATIRTGGTQLRPRFDERNDDCRIVSAQPWRPSTARIASCSLTW
jgi:hypothetical protein